MMRQSNVSILTLKSSFSFLQYCCVQCGIQNKLFISHLQQLIWCLSVLPNLVSKIISLDRLFQINLYPPSASVLRPGCDEASSAATAGVASTPGPVRSLSKGFARRVAICDATAPTLRNSSLIWLSAGVPPPLRGKYQR